MLGLLLLPIAAALAESAPDDTERNARRLEKLRADPAVYDRLKRDLRAFCAMSAEKQEQLRQLDRDLHDQDSATQRHLWDVLERFSAWLEHLPEEDRRRIETAASRDERLKIIKEIREQEFIRRLPRKEREELLQLADEARAEKLAQLRDTERDLRRAMVAAGNTRPGARTNRPVRPADLSPEAREYIDKSLRPQLSDEEKKRLKDAEGKWPLFARTLLDLAEQHPVRLLGSPYGPTQPAQLKGEAKTAYATLRTKPGALAIVQNKVGQWPDFGIALMKACKVHKVMPPKPFGPCRPEEFPAVVQTFINDELLPKLTAEEKEKLEEAKGSWPEYPELLKKLADDHNLEIPLMRLPGARELADKVKSLAEVPDLPDRTLREFVAELTPDERAKLQLSSDDPESRERLMRAYYQRHPRELKRLKGLDERTFTIKK
jgi:hypothetical protein